MPSQLCDLFVQATISCDAWRASPPSQKRLASPFALQRRRWPVTFRPIDSPYSFCPIHPATRPLHTGLMPRFKPLLLEIHVSQPCTKACTRVGRKHVKSLAKRRQARHHHAKVHAVRDLHENLNWLSVAETWFRGGYEVATTPRANFFLHARLCCGQGCTQAPSTGH